MKWITHQTGAIVLGLALQLPAAGIAAASAGAILPDLADQKIAALAPGRRQRQKIFNKIHRGATHWFGWWLGLFLAVLYFPLQPLASEIAAGLAFGGLSHVALDMLTPHGVPLLPFARNRRVAIAMCGTGSAGEYVFLLLLLGAGLFFFGNGLLPELAKLTGAGV